MLSNMSDQSPFGNFSTINTNGKAATTIVSGVIENNNVSSSNNNNNNNKNSNNNNNNMTMVPNQLNGLGSATIYENGYNNFSHDKHDYSLHTEISANSYETYAGHNDFHSYSKSPDQQRSPGDEVMQIDMPVGNDGFGEVNNDDGEMMAGDAVEAVGGGSSIPDHHARRPMNAFLIFCKRHRPVVREKYPNLENRAITKILGDWWAYLDVKDKSAFTDLAKQYKDAFFSANPDFKWYKLPAPPLRTLSTRPCNSNEKPDEFSTNHFCAASDFPPSSGTINREKHIRTNLEYFGGASAKKHADKRSNPVGVFKLADETQMGGLSSLLVEGGGSRRYDDIDHVLDGENEGASMLHNEPELQQRYKALSDEPLSNMRHHAEQMQAQTVKNLNNNNNNVSSSKNQSELEYRREIEQQWKNMDIDNKLNFSPHLENMLRNQTAISADIVHTIPVMQSAEAVMGQNVGWTPPKSIVASEAVDDQQKSARSCKGKRYQEFMTGKMSPKKTKVKTSTSFKGAAGRNMDPQTLPTVNNSTNTFPHNGYCKPTDAELVTDDETPETARKLNAAKIVTNLETQFELLQPQTANEMAKNMYNTSDFNLEGKILSLPCLSLDSYLSRKRETKKKKKISGKAKAKAPKQPTDAKRLEIVGSQKRKARKESITRRDINSTVVASSPLFLIDEIKVEPDVGNEDPLSVLAEVAARAETQT